MRYTIMNYNVKFKLTSIISFSLLMKSFLWTLATIAFGLLQLWLIWLISFFYEDKSFSFEAFLDEGALLFFVTAIIASITIDYLLSKNTDCCTPLEIFLFIVFPLVMLIIVVFLFFISYFDFEIKDSKLDTKLLYSVELVLLVITFIYSFIIKYHAFKPCK